MAFQAKQIFVNLPVKDLKKSIAFFTEIGFEFNTQMTDENATSMIISENIYVMLLVEEFFKSFTNKAIGDTTEQAEVIVALSAGSREEVDEVVNKALAAGAGHYNDPVDHGFMYTRSFKDLDGHLWEVFIMEEMPPAEG
ncbi:extradiol dioxygenase [Paenibacillus albidus]|uniref:Extradiol dioxygenase n=1 Tax=Paenibacillus albidus TaxID=2041023 RepID=A0A917D4T6_9BACL|nr:VOC family protein [Paenibacillus albidus]MBT2293330.1 VOC family protein [Paenibacillus albidus]GGG10812.1 extradiol dioxygenase [Paenibacillus albidus]